MLVDAELLAKIDERAQALSPEAMAEISNANIASALEAVYFASIRMEEGEKVLPSVLLAAESGLGRVQEFAQILRFEGDEQVTPELLRKRSLAFDRRESSFLAVPRADHLALVGVAHWADPAQPATLQKPSLGMHFDAEDTGTVSVSLGRIRIGIFRDGNFHSSRQSVFASPVFKRSLSTTFNRLYQNDERVLAHMATLQYIVERAADYGRGGTIIAIDDFMPVSLDNMIESGEKISYEPRKRQTLDSAPAIEKSIFALNVNQTSVAALSPDRRAYLRFVARLACVDGALILNHKLHPIRMGAKLKAPTSSEPLYLAGALDNPIAPVLRGVGTRHSSALNFVSAAKRAVAFTISSDGPVSAFGWLDERLAWWRNAL